MTIEQILSESYPTAKMHDSFADMGMDSLDYLQFMVEVEREMSIALPKRQIFGTPQQLAEWVAAQ